MSNSKELNKELEKELEKELSELLTGKEIDISEEERRLRELKQLASRYEIRIQTQLDPILEETHIFRSMAKEVDHRYDDYLKKVDKSDK